MGINVVVLPTFDKNYYTASDKGYFEDDHTIIPPWGDGTNRVKYRYNLTRLGASTANHNIAYYYEIGDNGNSINFTALTVGNDYNYFAGTLVMTYYPSASTYSSPFNSRNYLASVGGANTMLFTIALKCPVFTNRDDALEYCLTGNYENAENYVPPLPDEEKIYFINNKYRGVRYRTTGEIIDTTEYTNLKAKFSLVEVGKPYMYYKSGVTDLKLVSGGEIDIFEYSNNGGESWAVFENLAYSDFCSQTEHYSNKYYYRADILETNIPIFGSASDGEGYLNGDISIEVALNYDDISRYNDKGELIGESEDATEMSTPYIKPTFCSNYLLSHSALAEIANNFYSTDTNIIDAIKEGLSMYGANPIESVISLMYYPFDVSQYVSGSEQHYIYFGSYQLELTHSVTKIVYQNQLIDCGSSYFRKTFNDFRDYEPYTNLYVYVPYCGVHKLQIADYLGKTMKIKYAFDITTGGCNALIFADDILLNTFNGCIGVEIPLTATNKVQYANNLIGAFLNPLQGGSSDVITGVTKGIGGAMSGGVGGALGVVGGAVALGNSALQMGGGIFNASQQMNSHKVSVRGSSGSSLEQFSPQYPYFIFTRCKTYPINNEANLVGLPSMKSGKIENFSGFLSCSDVHLVCEGATAKEKAMIERQLKSGVYIV